MLSNWENEKAYPNPEKMPMEGWAWEFLRRNGDYRKTWEKYVDRSASLTAKYGPEIQLSIEVLTGTEAWFCDPPADPGETLKQWRKRVQASGRKPIGPLPLSQGMAKEWMLKEMFNPDFSWLHVEGEEFRPVFEARWPLIEYVPADIGGSYSTPYFALPFPTRLNVAVIEIDLARSIESQLLKALPRIEAKKENLIADGVLETLRDNPKPWDYPDLLRILDARTARESSGGEHPSDEYIANVLYAHKKEGGTAQNIRKRHKSAQRIVNKGYFSLLP